MILRVGGVVLSGALALAGIASRGDAQGVEPEAYRNEDYRAPTPAALSGAQVITTAQAQAIWRAGAGAFVDVMPYVARPA
ncbi:MAG TPA: PQQ-dependent catabolism-associated CXXCW motif protein, partial [Methyloceanibacter sp.]